MARWQPGQSGNPKGSKKGPNYRERGERVFNSRMSITKMRQVWDAIIEAATKGEPWACEMVVKRITPAVQAVEVETVDQAPVSELVDAIARVSAARRALEAPRDAEPTGANGSGGRLQ